MIAVAPTNGSEFKSTAELLVEEVSASRLKRWSTCRLQFFFHYVQQIKKPATPALAVGKVVHAVLQQWNQARWRGEFGFRDNLNGVFAAKWMEEQAGQEIDWDDGEEKQRQSALTMLELYLDQTPIKPDEKPMALEVQLEADLGKHGLPKIIGFIDLVRPGGTIVDFKTSAQTPNAEAVAHQNEIQLTCYGLLYRDATDQVEAGFELHHLVKTKTPKLVVTSLPPITDNQQTRLFKQIESYVEGVDREDYVPSVGMVSNGVGRLFDLFGHQSQRIEAYKNYRMRDKSAHDLVIRAVDVGACTNRMIPAIVKEWREPRFPEAFSDRTAWSLFNAFTETLKGNLTELPKRTQALHALFDTTVGLPAAHLN